MRAVLDANVLVSALLSRGGAPAELLRRWTDGEFELVVSERLLAEVGRALRYPKIRARVVKSDASAFLTLLGDHADVVDDPVGSAPVRSRDPGDDYLVALAFAEKATIVSGDAHLLALADAIPVRTPRGFLDSL